MGRRAGSINRRRGGRSQRAGARRRVDRARPPLSERRPADRGRRRLRARHLAQPVADASEQQHSADARRVHADAPPDVPRVPPRLRRAQPAHAFVRAPAVHDCAPLAILGQGGARGAGARDEAWRRVQRVGRANPTLLP
eukprot:5624778-Prymnesium_polylepis.1